MPEFSWEFDAPSGTYKSHFMSKKIRVAAIAKCVFKQFTQPEPGFGKQKGDTVTLTKVKNITTPTTAVLNEHIKIPVDTFDVDTGTITVSEYGRAVEYTSLAKDLTHYDMKNKVQRKLRDQMALTLDGVVATAFKSTYVKAIPTAASTITWDTDGTASTSATHNLNFSHVGLIRDYMQDTLNIPWYNGETYMSIASTKALRGIKSDGEFQAWRQYIQPKQVLYKSEVGMLEQIRFVESNNTSALSNALGTSSVLGGAVIFGEDAVAEVEVETPHLRAAIPGDFGRSQAVAWYGLLAYGLVWAATATAGEVRVVEVTSS